MRQPVSHYDEPEQSGGGFELVGDERDEEPARRDRRLPAIALTLVVMALFAGGLWFAYVQGTRHAAVAAPGGDVPLIRADERPTKVKPDQPGGMPMPDQNVSLYNDRRGKPSVEKLLPPPEEPMPRPAPPPKQAAAPPPAPTVPAPAPADTAATAMPAPPASQPAAAKPAAATIPEPRPHSPLKAATPHKEAVSPSRWPPPSGAVQVRLGSLRSPEAAREEWTRLKRENADLLGALRANAVAVDLGDKGIYYRILAGPFTDATAAERLCAEMKRRNRGCILAR